MTTLPIFETERLILRGITLADAPATQKNFNDYAVIGELGAVIPWPYPEDGARDFIEKLLPAQGRARWVWAIFLQDAPTEAIGNIDLRKAENHHTQENRGFWLARKHWGRGLMTEALTPITDYAFDRLGFDKLILSNALGNLRSRRIKEKAGATWLRTEPAKFVNPDYTEREVWELRKADWQKAAQ